MKFKLICSTNYYSLSMTLRIDFFATFPMTHIDSLVSVKTAENCRCCCQTYTSNIAGLSIFLFSALLCRWVMLANRIANAIIVEKRADCVIISNCFSRFYVLQLKRAKLVYIPGLAFNRPRIGMSTQLLKRLEWPHSCIVYLIFLVYYSILLLCIQLIKIRWCILFTWLLYH